MLLFSKITRHRLCAALLAAAMFSVPLVVEARPASPAEVKIPLNDARQIGSKSVRFSAAQFTREAPTVVLFGADTPTWHKVRAALRQAVYEGYPISGVFIGKVSDPPALEIYAQGHHVTNPIDPRKISETELTKLIRDVTREYYRR